MITVDLSQEPNRTIVKKALFYDTKCPANPLRTAIRLHPTAGLGQNIGLMTPEQHDAEIRLLKAKVERLTTTVETLMANLLLRTVQINHLVGLFGAASQSGGAEDPSGLTFEAKFDAEVREKLHQYILDIGETGSPVAQLLQRLLDSSNILPDIYGIADIEEL